MPGAASAACTAPGPSNDFGSATTTLTVPSAATYNIWTRMKAGGSTANSFNMDVDGGACYQVGGANTSSTAWTWVNYQGGNTANKVQQSLGQGAHTIKMYGTQAGVEVDRIIAVSDLSCVPTGTDGTNCNNPGDTTSPTVALTAPAANVTVSGATDISANATDNTQVAKVEFYVNSTLVNTDTTAPYTYKWDTSLLPNGSYTILAKAYDAAGNTASDTRPVMVKNNDTQAPTTPTALTATASSFDKVNLAWSASTDNIAVKGYIVTRNGSPIASLGAVTSYTDSSVSPKTTYSYQVAAVDVAGNQSAPTTAIKVTTGGGPTDSQAPTAPGNLETQAVSPSQVNLKWVASTDNVGVASYQVFRQSGVSTVEQIATVSGKTTTFGDTTLKAHTTYTYSVKAVDAAGNVSPRSNLDTITTHSTQKTSELIGYIRDTNGKGIPYASVSFPIDGVNHTYKANSQGWYDADGVPGGSYWMTFSAPGYKSLTISRNVNVNARVAQHATLERQ
ncbi:MAG TPA: Ig-like domain-containing protein [Candidatus Saccharimonadales bacterium]|nr:Ig-like domain-containing protein [Candidatus Saccharimonadales bacterium]